MGHGEKMQKFALLIALVFAAAAVHAGFDACQKSFTDVLACKKAGSGQVTMINANGICFPITKGKVYAKLSSASASCTTNSTVTVIAYSDAKCTKKTVTLATNKKIGACASGYTYTCGKCPKQTVKCTRNSGSTTTGSCSASGSSTTLPSMAVLCVAALVAFFKQ